MKRISLFTLGATLGVGLVTTACSSSSSSKPTAEEYDDTAQAISSTAAPSNAGTSSGGDVASMTDTVSLSLGVVPAGISLMGNGHFHGTRLGVDYDYSLTCKTLAGVAGACGPTTDSATAAVMWSGNLSSTAVDADVTRTGSWSVTGLQGDTATFTGDSSFTFDATLRSIFRPGVTTTYTFDASASYDAVKIATAQRNVIGGSASFDIMAHHMVTGSGSNNVDASFDVNAKLTFNADQTASLVLDGDQSYTLNLTTGAVARVTTN
jgi:hypothetical protein